MAASITHLVVGEHVFKQISNPDLSLVVYGSFLTGCSIVDLQAFHTVDRRITHFVGRLDTDGEDAYRKSCTNFLQELDFILKNKWKTLSPTDQAFIVGYLCHLATDECWKKLNATWFHKLNIVSYKELPVHPDVMLTAFDFLSQKHLTDPILTFAALENIQIPDVFNHVPHAVFCHQWEVIQEYVKSKGTFEAYVSMLKRADKYTEKVQQEMEQRFGLWGKAIELIEIGGGELQFIQNATLRSVEAIKLLGQTYPVSF